MGRSGYDITGMTICDYQVIDTPASICTEATEDLEEAHPLHTVRTQFLHVVMAAHKRAVHDPNDISPDGASNSKRQTGSLKENDSNEYETPSKRARLLDGASTLDSAYKQSTGTTNKRRTQNRRLWLACPFAKKDPVRYRNCYRYTLGRIRDVKQHLNRCHRKPICCPRCWEVFEDEDIRDGHIRVNECSQRLEIEIEGISEKQRRVLGQRVSSKMPEEQQWFAVFDILFSPLPRPRSPYIDRDLSEQMSVFHDFYTSKGPELLSEFLESTGVVTWNLPQEERDLATFQEEILGDGLLQIWDHWISANTVERPCDAEPRTPTASQSNDSGVALQDVPGKSSVFTLQAQEEVPLVPTTSSGQNEHSFLSQEPIQSSAGANNCDLSKDMPSSSHAGTDPMIHDDILSQIFDPSFGGFTSTSGTLLDFDFDIDWGK
ncbi:hypothetical protein PG991_007311 [Apiospora marii]|uniref:C2H2-type domain-containing protein n=1 Tax=Apiospora marii TaxID=335849 RepID=A0ABR1RT30_9PEZI